MKDLNRIDVISIIPTKNRPRQLHQALTSVTTQTKKPLLTYVINDCDDEFIEPTIEVVRNFESAMNLILLENNRTRGLSGSVNTALFDIKIENKLEMVFVAFLDDDDWWDRTYIEKCSTRCLQTNSDWVISGLIRYDESNIEGLKLAIPSKISIGNFLVTNPNIQGSNLFIRYAKMIEIGGFDEKLVSTTDRDVCIRLLETKITHSILNEHLIHHWAYSSGNRLSSRGSEKKRLGLTQFYKKYENRMNKSQKELFKKRAKSLFNVEISESE